MSDTSQKPIVLNTLADYAKHRHRFSVYCRCGRHAPVDMAALIERLGADFDPVGRGPEIAALFRCSRCGERGSEVTVQSADVPKRRFAG